MRVAFVIADLGMGGAEAQVCSLAAGLVRRGVKVQIIPMAPLIAEHPQLSSVLIPVRTLGMTQGRWTPGDFFRYLRTVREFRPDIIHAHMFHASLLARVGRLFTGGRVVCTVHGVLDGPSWIKEANIRTRIRERIYRLTDPLCDLTSQVSVAGAERYVAVGATPASKMQFVPNGVDCARFRPDPELRRWIRGELGLADMFTWIWIGRMQEQKDPWTLLEAFRIASASGRPCVLLVLGSGPLEKEVRARAATSEVAAKVRFLGERSDVPALLNGADGLVLSSIFEGLPMVLLEAAATGLPLVVTSPGAEAVVPEKSGWVVKTRDPQALAERMCSLMKLSPESRRAMGEAGRNYVQSRFSLDAVLDTWERVYSSLLEKSAHAETTG